MEAVAGFVRRQVAMPAWTPERKAEHAAKMRAAWAKRQPAPEPGVMPRAIRTYIDEELGCEVTVYPARYAGGIYDDVMEEMVDQEGHANGDV